MFTLIAPLMGGRRLSDLVDTNDFVFLVGDPGMGKSSAMTKLEQDLRNSLMFPRVILRINLNSLYKKLVQVSAEDLSSFKFVLEELVSEHISARASQEILSGQYSLYLLLDGFDEVCPMHEKKLVAILKALVTDQNEGDKKYVRVKAVLTSRPHTKETIEKELNVKAIELTNLKFEEHVQYLVDSGCVKRKDDAAELINCLPDPSLVKNPIMLHMYSLVVRGKKLEEIRNLNMYDLYDRFICEKIVEKSKKKMLSTDDSSV